jgi:two-component system, response regulator
MTKGVESPIVTRSLLLNSRALKILAELFMHISQITSRFGASVRSLRHRLGISQEDLAERADLHRTYIAGIEAGGRNVTLKSINKLARALQVSVATLLSYASEPRGGGQLPGDPLSAGECASILLVEDNPGEAELVLRSFRQARIANPVRVVYDGQEALDFLFCAGAFASRAMTRHPQLVLLDVTLPKVSAMEAVLRIKADGRTRNIPLVLLTASRQSLELAKCRGLGVENYLVKPLDFQSLTQAASRLNLAWALLQRPPVSETAVRRQASFSKDETGRAPLAI